MSLEAHSTRTAFDEGGLCTRSYRQEGATIPTNRWELSTSFKKSIKSMSADRDVNRTDSTTIRGQTLFAFESSKENKGPGVSAQEAQTQALLEKDPQEQAGNPSIQCEVGDVGTQGVCGMDGPYEPKGNLVSIWVIRGQEGERFGRRT
ncbi:UNVERIFIED_CONTAM: hypothetical protein K2H54_066759 [Gekko kuhli]